MFIIISDIVFSCFLYMRLTFYEYWTAREEGYWLCHKKVYIFLKNGYYVSGIETIQSSD